MPFDKLDATLAEAAPVVNVGAPLTSVGKTLGGMDSDLDTMLKSRADVSSAARRGWLNDAYREMATAIDLPELKATFTITLVPDQHLYLLPTTIYVVSYVSLNDTTNFARGGKKLTLIDLETYRRLPALDDFQALFPDCYFLIGKMLVVYPTPSEAHDLVIDASFVPQDMVADTDSPLLPPDLHRGVVLKARAIAFDALEKYDSAVQAENSFVRFMRMRPDTRAEDNARLPSRFVPARSWEDLEMSE